MGSTGIWYYGTFCLTRCNFCLTRCNLALFPAYASKVPDFHGASGFCGFLEHGLGKRWCTFRNCGALARKTAHFHGLRHVCEKRRHACEKDGGCTCEKDEALLGLWRTRHNCGAAIKVQCTRLREKRRTYAIFLSAGATRLLHSF